MSWEQLEALIGENRDTRMRDFTERPISCPQCGNQLDENARGVLNCPFGHFTWRG